jgi:hypothetical protein
MSADGASLLQNIHNWYFIFLKQIKSRSEFEDNLQSSVPIYLIDISGEVGPVDNEPYTSHIKCGLGEGDTCARNPIVLLARQRAVLYWKITTTTKRVLLREEEEGKREKNLFKDQFQYCQP